MHTLDLLQDISSYTDKTLSDVVYINNNLYNSDFYHTIETTEYFITSRKYLIESIKVAEGSIFNKNTFAMRLKLSKKFDVALESNICENRVALFETLPEYFSDIDDKLKTIIHTVVEDSILNIIQNDDLIIYEKVPNRVLMLEDFTPALWLKYHDFAQSTNLFSTNKDEIKTLRITPTGDMFCLLDDIVFSSYTSHNIICNNIEYKGKDVQKFIIYDDNFEDLKQMAKCDNYLSTLGMGLTESEENFLYENTKV